VPMGHGWTTILDVPTLKERRQIVVLNTAQFLRNFTLLIFVHQQHHTRWRRPAPRQAWWYCG
jgi:hypothetical protein